MTRADAWGRLPLELRSYPQWVVAGASKAPMSVGSDGRLFNSSVNHPSEWLTFEQACQLAWDNRTLVTTHMDKRGNMITQTGLDIGYIIAESDPFTCIDLDVKDAVTAPYEPEKWTSPEQFDFYCKIVEQYGSYTERSRSGKGFHIWLRGAIGPGFRRDGIEVYSRERFIICTGDVFKDQGVLDRQSMLTNMVSQMRPVVNDEVLEELPPEEDNWYILNRASTAANKDKFIPLWQGKWQELGFPSQSEADLALMSMFTFYSKSNQQCRELFWESGLGKREKAHRLDYINYTLKIIRSRQRREERIDISAIAKGAELVQQAAASKQQQAAAEITRMQGGLPPQASSMIEPRSITSLHVEGQGTPIVSRPPSETVAAQMEPVNASVVTAGQSGLAWPPGLMGAVAQYIYQSAPRPVKEVAIVAALGLMAGLCGKAWNIPKSGLNLYVILVAVSAIGKEAMHGGIASIVQACGRKNPFFGNFVDFQSPASGQALLKACLGNKCFVNVTSEWGRKLRRLADDKVDGPTSSLRTEMTNLYQKSGPQSIVGGIGYSNTDNNVASVAGVSYSMIGETTPVTFFQSMTPSMMEDGFMSRFVTIEYSGQRPKQNENMLENPSDALVDALNRICQQASTMINTNRSIPLGRTEEAASMLKRYEDECDYQINSTQDESRRQMWNRAALKAMRIAGLLAVGDNYLTPCITAEHVTWAIDVISRDIALMSRRLDSGDVGSDDIARERKMLSIMRDYMAEPIPASYKVPDAMRTNSIVPYTYLQKRTQQASAFYGHKFGSNKALFDTISILTIRGVLMEVTKEKLVEWYNYHGKAYRILELPDD
jgi:hypothetical protein